MSDDSQVQPASRPRDSRSTTVNSWSARPPTSYRCHLPVSMDAGPYAATSSGARASNHIEAYSARKTERPLVLHPDGTIEMNVGPVEFKRR
ncbi:hypothetical protein ACFRI7_02795 [Streptomyces sp. NPDC056716]|uniref:hypothetical protein n=1 Tax=unclassified Streptomyces TaxID=2593676 RepID=UPI0036B6A0C5